MLSAGHISITSSRSILQGVGSAVLASVEATPASFATSSYALASTVQRIDPLTVGLVIFVSSIFLGGCNKKPAAPAENTQTQEKETKQTAPAIITNEIPTCMNCL